MKSNRKTPIYIALTLIAISIFSFVSLASVKHSIAFLKPEIISPATSNYAGSSPEPTAQPTNLTFSEISSFAYNAAFHHASPQPDGYIVLRSTGQAVIGAPFNGNTYHVGDAIGNARVVYIGSSNEFSPRGVVAGTTFHHNVYSFNGSEGNENYLLSNPLSGQVSTPANMMGDYYEGVNSKREDFVETLQDAIRPHNAFDYGDYIPVMISGFEARDTTGGQKVVYCVYSGYAHVYSGSFGWIGTTGGTLSREHTFAFSWFPHSSQSMPEYSDFFHLFPAHQNNANNRRSNHPLGVVQNVSYQFLDGKLGTDSQGKTVYEPRDSHKGDAARALFYMVTRYHNTGGNQWYLPSGPAPNPDQDQEILKLWHFTDPPDAWEMARNDYIYSKQGNRNPFIDSIHFVTKIDFQTMEWLRVEQIATPHFKASVFPNPVKDHLKLEVQALSPGSLKAYLNDITGIPVKFLQTNLTGGAASFEFNIADLAQGTYILTIIFKGQIHSIKVIKL